MKKSMEWECQQTERGSQKPPGTPLGCWSSLSFSHAAASFLYASLAALAAKGHDASVRWANFSRLWTRAAFSTPLLVVLPRLQRGEGRGRHQMPREIRSWLNHGAAVRVGSINLSGQHVFGWLLIFSAVIHSHTHNPPGSTPPLAHIHNYHKKNQNQKTNYPSDYSSFASKNQTTILAIITRTRLQTPNSNFFISCSTALDKYGIHGRDGHLHPVWFLLDLY